MKRLLFILLLSEMLLCSLMSQNISVSGRVLSEEQEGMLGVTIVIAGSRAGTTTDSEGKYSITVPSASSVLLFSYIGYETVELTVGAQRVINVSLRPDIQNIDEIVVVGYGEQKKASIVGAISNLRMDDLKRVAPSNLTSAIGGRIPGAMVRLGDGNIGGGDLGSSAGSLDNAEIYIRGQATTNSATPLILVDGVESSFSRINPEDIEQFSVLKDASATAVYGVRGANGVILITTKQGSIGRPKVSMNFIGRIHQPLKFPQPLGAYDYAVLYNEASKNMGNPEPYSIEDLEHWRLGDDPYGHPDVNWYDEVVKGCFFEEQYNVNIDGGTDFVKYYISGEYNHAGGPFKTAKELETKYNRYNLRTNFDFKFTKTTDLSVRLNGRVESKGDLNFNDSSGQRYYGSAFYAILASGVNVAPIYNPNGTYAYGDGGNWNLKAVQNEGAYIKRFSNTLDANLNLKQKLDFILPGLSSRLMYGASISSGSRRFTSPSARPALWSYNVNNDKYTLMRPQAAPYYVTDYLNLAYARNSQLEAALNYRITVVGKHNITAMAVFMQSKSETGATLPVSRRGASGRITYDYRNKYLAEINAGYNGSDQFAKGNRYALFPAASIGWVLSEEGLVKKKASFVDFFKIKASYGTAGNDRVGGYRYLYRYTFDQVSNRWTSGEVYNFGVYPTNQTGMAEGTIGNDNVTWEVAKKTNIGMEGRFGGNRIRFEVALFFEKRDNILAVRKDVPLQSGLNPSKLPAQNITKVSNKGYEFELSYSDNFGDFSINVGGNYTFARSNIDFIPEAQKRYPWMMQVNHSIGQRLGYIWTGKFYDVDDIDDPTVPTPEWGKKPGELMFKDLNGDGIIDSYDQAYTGYPSIPEIIYGFNTNFGYKNFYVDLFWQGASNLTSRYSMELRYEFYSKNVLPFHLNRWVYDPEKGLDTRATATYPALEVGGAYPTRVESTFQFIDGAYLRLKSVEIGYKFPSARLKKLDVSSLRFFVSGSNLLTIDKVKFIDPEYNTNTSGWRGTSFPQTKFYAAGLNVTF